MANSMAGRLDRPCAPWRKGYEKIMLSFWGHVTKITLYSVAARIKIYLSGLESRMNLHESVDNKTIEYGSDLAWSKARPVIAEQASLIFDKQKFFAQVMGDMNLAKKVLKIFMDEAPLLMRGLEKAVNDGALESCQAIAHKIAGTAGSISALSLWSAAKQMEQAVLEKENVNLRLMKDEVLLQFDLFKRVIGWWGVLDI